MVSVGILCTYSSCVLHFYMLILFQKGTWQYQNPRKPRLKLVNWLDVLLKKALGEIGLVSFFFSPHYPQNFLMEQAGKGVRSLKS